MDPLTEQNLRNEVIFLHSLWHQGPSPPPPPPAPFPPQHHHFFQPLNPTIFKKPQRPSKTKRDIKKMKTQQEFQLSTSEWPCPSPPLSNSTSWPSFPAAKSPSDAAVQFSSVKVQAWDVGNRLQLKVVQEVKNFFRDQKDESDDEDEDDEMEDSDSDEDSGDYAGFFLKLFEGNEELREFYVKNHGDGEFGCLVCGGVGFIRRFNDCVALVQHTVSISKTKKMKAHRAFGKVVCEVLGWDIDKLPSIASSISEMKNAASSTSEEVQPEVQEKVASEEHNVESHDKETGKEEFDGVEQLPNDGALAVAEIEGDCNTIAPKLKEHDLDIEQGSIEGSVDCLEAPPLSNSTSWPSFPATQFPSDTDIHFASAKVQAWDVGNRMQLKVVQEVKKFFRDQKDESDDDNEDDEMEDDDSDEDSGDEEGGYSGVFLKLFKGNEELREFYVNNHENGEFGCLVCGGVGFIRRFKDCVALVQHTVSISKTKKMKAHRAFGKVVCEVLGWDINQLPSIASSISEKKNAASSKLEEAGLSNGSKGVGRDADASYRNSAVETKGSEATGDEKLPTTDTSDLAQGLQSVSGVGGIVNDHIKETLDGKQENAETTSN